MSVKCATQRGKQYTSIGYAQRKHPMCSDVRSFVTVGEEVAKVKSEWWRRFDIGKYTLTSFVYLNSKIPHYLQHTLRNFMPIK